MNAKKEPQQVHLEDQYHPLGIKAVQAAAELASDHIEAIKEKPKKKAQTTEFMD